MKNVCLYFQIHHPFNLQTFRFFDIGESKSYYDNTRIEREIQDAATNYYLPTNNYLLKLIHQNKENLKLTYSISGTALDQILIYTPELISSFRQLAATGQVEFAGTTAWHSIVSLTDKNDEFAENIKQNRQRTEYYFEQKPTVFVNTDLLFTDQIAKIVAEAGYPAILSNGISRALHWRSPNYLYSSGGSNQIRLLFRNEKISNELTAILANPNKKEAQKQIKGLFAALETIQPEEPIINIYLNYKTLGGANKSEKQQLLRLLISKIIKDQSFCFSLPSRMTEQYGPISEIETEVPICWIEHFHPEYYPGNVLQKDAIRQLFKLSKKVESTDNSNLKIEWYYLQSSDHFHLMDENHPDYQDNTTNSRIFKSKYEAYINYMNILEDFKGRIINDTKIEKTKKAVHKSSSTANSRQSHEF